VRVVVIGDIGVIDDMIHIGDEAMFEELARQLTARGAEITAISSNPTDTISRYGVTAIDRQSLDSGAAAETVRASDAVVIAGGGNLASNWPEHIRMRSTLGELAAQYSKPMVISGQTIGPRLTGQDADAVSVLLGSAQLVGVREPASFDLALALGVDPRRLVSTIDDASFLAADAAAPPAAPYCLVSLSLHTAGIPRPSFVGQIAALLDHVATATGLDIRFLAHFGSTRAGVAAGDSLLHAEVAGLMSSSSSEVALTDASSAAAWARGAELVLTSRYHPAVFAVSAGVPTIGVHVDEYTRVKLTGALGNFGQSSVLASSDLEAAAELVSGLWTDRAHIRAAGRTRAAVNRASSDEWWDRLWSALSSPQG